MLDLVRRADRPQQVLQGICALAVSSSEAECLKQLVLPSTHVNDDELEEIIEEFICQRRATRRLSLLRRLAVRVGNVEQLRLLLTSADQLEMDELLTHTLHEAPSDNRKELVDLLLNLSETKYEVSANVNSRLHGKTAFHVAAEYAYHDILTSLLPLKSEDCSALTSSGATALHCLIRADGDARYKKGVDQETREKNMFTCLKLLVDDLKIDINKQDNGGYTAIHLACIKKSWKIVKYLFENKANIDVFINDKSARDYINANTDIKILQPIDTHVHTDIIKDLFDLISKKNEEELVEKLETVDKNINNGEFTLLQATVNNRLFEATKKLLGLGADVNKNCGDLRYPVMIAACDCDEEMLDLILNEKDVDLSVTNSNSQMYSVLHMAVLYSKPGCQCVKLLCDYKFNNTLDINATDMYGKTALHYAIENKQENNIIHLLRRNINIFIKSNEDVPAFAGADVEFIQGYFDDRIKVQGSAFDKNSNHNLITDFSFLVMPQENIFTNNVISDAEINTKENSHLIKISEIENTAPDMYSLLLLSKSRTCKTLLNHPVIRSFLHLKWHQFFWLFYFNFLLLATFTASFSTYIYFLVNDVNNNDGLNNSSENINSKDFQSSGVKSGFYFTSWIFAAGTLSLIILREIFQIIISVSFWHYISYIVNIIEVTLIIVSTLLLFFVPYDYHAIHTLSAIGVLLAFAELVILIGSHPVLTVYYTMLFRVGKDFLYFLLWYSLLVIAFGISFYILFQHCKEGDDCSENLFVSIWTAIFKTTVMLQGEFDASNLKFDSFNVISHVIFLFFFFSMVIVLMNLLNGLAVSDIQIIKNESTLISMEYQVKLYAKFENIIFNTINKKCKSLGYFLIRNTVLLNGLLKENKLEYSLRKNICMHPDVRNSCNRICFDCNNSELCGFQANCLKSKHFKSLFPLCFEFDKIIEEMIYIYTQRCHYICNFESEIKEVSFKNYVENDEERNLIEQQKILQQSVRNIDRKLDALLKALENKAGLKFDLTKVNN